MFKNKILKSQRISKRPLQVAKEIKLTLSNALMKNQVVSEVLFDKEFLISYVEVSSDLSWAKIYVYPFNNNIEPKVLIGALKDVSGQLRTIVAKHLTTRKVPKLMFLIDDHFDKLEKVNKLIDKANLGSNELRESQEKEETY